MFSRFQGSTPRNEVAGASLMEQNLLDASHLHFYRVVLQRGDTIPCESSLVCVRSRWFARCLFLPSLSSYCVFLRQHGAPRQKSAGASVLRCSCICAELILAIFCRSLWLLLRSRRESKDSRSHQIDVCCQASFCYTFKAAHRLNSTHLN
jgi:hypothetical protein